METTNTESEAIPQVVFRAGKKRKAYRQRAEEPETTTVADNREISTDGAAGSPKDGAPAERTTEQDDSEAGLPVSEVLKLRNARKPKLAGVEFRAGPSGLGSTSGSGDDYRATSEETADRRALVLHGGDSADASDAAPVVLPHISDRFAPQTGLVGELVNKHMEEYVESELARRKRLAAAAAAKQQQQQEEEERQRREGGGSGALTGDNGLPIESQRVLQGRLLEIDLGDEARARNIAMTERARRRLQGQIEEEEEAGRQQKVRLGRDGKPIRSRNRRGSDDIKRDQLVEQFLSENKIDLYDTQSAQATEPAIEDEEELAADDRIAEEFRREFFDALAQRHRRRRAVNAAKSGPKKTEEILRGPKLGGSRNDRALMREKLLEEQRARQQQQQRRSERNVVPLRAWRMQVDRGLWLVKLRLISPLWLAIQWAMHHWGNRAILSLPVRSLLGE
ncbi:hypothetical protein VTJ49DRAFT_2912 [Mycothermus thermophilus]|uniref:Uncharacterized protein n=1 Tax=Humicola insolens TaxID=85995 RepID=A0ABR3VMR4_HUMIN